jgi:Protein of unknown function (DUF1566)
MNQMYSICRLNTGFPAVGRMSSVLSSLILGVLIVFFLLFMYRSEAVAEVQDQALNPDANVITYDGRFIAYDNGTVKDTRTGLMWAAKDGGKAIEEADLKTYFSNYRAGGYDDWRIPTIDELEEIYDEGTENKHGYHLTELIDLAGEWVWGLDGRDLAISFGFIEGSPAIAFFDGPGAGAWYQTKKAGGGGARPLPVRATGKFQTEKRETGDGRFIAHYNGTVSDKKTGLMWAARDDGIGINKRDLSAYFNNYRAGGYDDWRIPTVDELKTIYDPAGKKHISCITDLIHVSDEWVWALGDKEFALGYSFFHGGSEGYAGKDDPGNLGRLDYLLVCRALPVRGGR